MATASTSLSLKEYLKRYQDSVEDQKKKKKKKPKTAITGGVLIVDGDPVWQNPVQIEEKESDSSGDDRPQVDEDIEVKRMKRLEALRARKPYHSISEDGSGWVTISNPSKPSSSVDGSRDLSRPLPSHPRFDTPSPKLDKKPTDTGDADISPPRQRRRRADTPSPEPEANGSIGGMNSVTSPPKHTIEDISPPRRRQGTATPFVDLSPPRRSRNDSMDDLSPPRRGPARSQEPVDLSPPRRSQRGSSGDAHMPRGARHRSPDARGPPRGASAVDPSPLRSSNSSLRDLSPPLRAFHRSPEGARPRGSAGPDLSPPRKERKEASPVRESQRAGLFSGKEIKEGNEKKKKEEMSRHASMVPLMSGKGAEPVFRDKEGRRISKELLSKKKEEEKPKEKKLEWGKGLAQKREAEARALELELEKDKPFARTRDDPELDKVLREAVRWGDPMAHLVKRKNPEPALEDLGENEKMKESGFIIPQSVPSHSWLKRGIDFPPNRYGIRPGRHWDGVDRSNGFEKEFFKRQNEKGAVEREAYLWSVSEM